MMHTVVRTYHAVLPFKHPPWTVLPPTQVSFQDLEGWRDMSMKILVGIPMTPLIFIAIVLHGV